MSGCGIALAYCVGDFQTFFHFVCWKIFTYKKNPHPTIYLYFAKKQSMMIRYYLCQVLSYICSILKSTVFSLFTLPFQTALPISIFSTSLLYGLPLLQRFSSHSRFVPSPKKSITFPDSSQVHYLPVKDMEGSSGKAGKPEP